ncbi:MAG TPA: hypothetical protein VHX86_14780 [Tepidisphaeraceae bacterium]|jgi:hypothetical protein|nr:hypothetical protein [Tepidisphaeraceae bacterium]
MSKAKRSASAPSRKSSASSELRWRIALHAMIFIIFASAVVCLFRISEIYVDRRLTFPTRPPKVVLADRPQWMSDFLAEQIVKSIQPIGLHSAFDRQLLVNTEKSLVVSPWVRHVDEVRRVYDQKPGDTVEIVCDYRAPAALVQWGQYYWLVDDHGVKLPEQYTADLLPKIVLGADGKVNIRIIDGVSHAPCESGRTWQGDDLAGGLEMARLIAGQDWANQIRAIDVSNFAGRHDPRNAQIVLITQFGTQLRWGRVPSATDAFVEVSAAQKLAAIENIYRKNNRVDADQPWIDVRFDQVTCPGPAQGGPAQDATAQIDNRIAAQ